METAILSNRNIRMDLMARVAQTEKPIVRYIS